MTNWLRTFLQLFFRWYSRSILLAWLIRWRSHSEISQTSLQLPRVHTSDVLVVRYPLILCHICDQKGGHERSRKSVGKWLWGILQRRKNAPWPIFPLRIILYELKSHKVKTKDIQELDHFHFTIKYFHGYDPRWVVRQHYERIGHNTRYSSMSTTEDDNIKNCYNVKIKLHLWM